MSELLEKPYLSKQEIKSLTMEVDFKNLQDAISSILIGTELNGDSINLRLFNSTSTLVVGTKNNGLYERYISPFIQILSCVKDKPSMVILDHTSDLFKYNSNKLKNEGYNIKVLNLENPKISNSLNPITILYDLYQEAHSIENSSERNQYLQDINNIAKLCTEILFSQTQGLSAVQSKEVLLAVILTMLEDHNITKEKFNLYTAYQFIVNNDLQDIKKYTYFDRPSTSIAIESGLNVSKMLSSQFNVTQQIIKEMLNFLEDNDYHNLINTNTIDLDEFLNTPTALFIIPSKSPQINFLSSIYLSIIEESILTKRMLQQQTNGKHIYMFLNEITEIPYMPYIRKPLFMGASYKIFSVISTDSFTKLEKCFGEDDFNAINLCETNIYFHTTDSHTKYQLAKSFYLASKPHDYSKDEIVGVPAKIDWDKIEEERNTFNQEDIDNYIKDMDNLPINSAIIKLSSYSPFISSFISVNDSPLFDISNANLDDIKII